MNHTTAETGGNEKMSGKSINEKLFEEAKVAIGRLLFDISVDKKTNIQQAQRLVKEIGDMISALDPKGNICESIVNELRNNKQ